MSTSSVIDVLRAIDENKIGFFEKLATVADIMTRAVKTLSLDDKLGDASKLFQEAKIHHAPVIDPDSKQVVGILSDRDVLRAMPRYLGTLMEGDKDRNIVLTKLSSILTRKPIHVSQNSPLSEAIRLLLKNHLDCLLVYDNPAELQGIVTPRDFLKVLSLYFRVCLRNGAPNKRLRLIDLADELSTEDMFQRGAQTVEDVMSGDLFTLKDDSTIQDAINLMQEKQVRHLPIVVDENERPVAVVSDRDILEALSPTDGTGGGAHGPTQAKFRARLFACSDKDSALRDRVRGIIGREPTTVPSDTPFKDAITTLLDENINCLPVVTADGRLCGMFTSTDVLRFLLAVLRLSRQAPNGPDGVQASGTQGL